MIQGIVVCDWCGMNVYYWEEPPEGDYTKGTSEEALRKHKQSFDTTLRCLHRRFLVKNLLVPEVMTA